MKARACKVMFHNTQRVYHVSCSKRSYTGRVAFGVHWCAAPGSRGQHMVTTTGNSHSISSCGREACLYELTLTGTSPQSRVGEIRLKPNFSSRFWDGTEIIGVVYSGTDSVRAIPLGNNEVAFVPVYADTFLARMRLGEIKVIGYGIVDSIMFGNTTDAFHVEFYTPGGQLLERSSRVWLERWGEGSYVFVAIPLVPAELLRFPSTQGMIPSGDGYCRQGLWTPTGL
jgi:hypothetical protein